MPFIEWTLTCGDLCFALAISVSFSRTQAKSGVKLFGSLPAAAGFPIRGGMIRPVLFSTKRNDRSCM